MKIIKPSATYMKHDCTPYQFIEKVGRTCYKSEDKIEEGSDERFVKNLVKRQHTAMLEHETLFLLMSKEFMDEFMFDMDCLCERLTFFNITRWSDRGINILSGSFRSFIDLFKKGYESRPLDFIQLGMCKTFPTVFGEFSSPIPYYEDGSCCLYDRQEFIKTFKNRPDILSHHLTHTFRFVCDRGVSHELVRHRVAFFAQESTRYCNYGKEDEITVIEPFFFDKNSFDYALWKATCIVAEQSYLALVKTTRTPQEARTVLPNSLKTEIIITATEEEWQHIVNLRYLGTTGAPHPQMKEVMGLALEDLMNESNGRINILDKGAK